MKEFHPVGNVNVLGENVGSNQRELNESRSLDLLNALVSAVPETVNVSFQNFVPALSSGPAPYSPIKSPIDKTKELGQWTKNLLAGIASPNKGQDVTTTYVTPPTSITIAVIENKPSDVSPIDIRSQNKNEQSEIPIQVKIPENVPRVVLNPDETLKELGLDFCMDQLTENVRIWFSKMILKPLFNDINEVTAAFSKYGFDHLNPYHPASFGIPMTNSSLNGQSILKNMITITPVSGSQPQSLVDLAQTHKDDSFVQKRLRIERYLSFASLAARRAHVISRIRALAKDNYMAAFSPLDGLDSDTDILLYLFCTFMDENLPSSDFFDNSPFSSKYFKPIGETPSSKSDAIQIVHVAFQTFHLVAGKYVFTSYCGPNNLFHAIIFMTEFVHCHRGGFLGIGNLSSRAINLTRIFEPNTN